MSLLRIPSLGADMVTVTLVAWQAAPGTKVAPGDVVAVLETARGTIEIEACEAATIISLLAEPGQALPVGAVIAEIAAAPARPEPGASARPVATPAARRRAAALGIPLERLRGTGVAGAICLADLETERPARARFEQPAMRVAVAAARGRAEREIPYLYLSETIDLTPGLDRLAALNAGRDAPARILPAALLLRAIALAVAETPSLNGFWEDGRFRPGAGVHVGWAASLRGGGLIAPVIRNADTLGLDALSAALADISPRGSEPSVATITVTHLGERGAESVLPVILPPQVAMLGIGRIVTRPWVVGEAVVPRRVVTITLAVDHRAGDGDAGGRLLARIARHLAQPGGSAFM